MEQFSFHCRQQRKSETVAQCVAELRRDPKLKIRLACDVSGYNVGAVLSHVLPDGSETPVDFSTRTL